jgi:hypothetical protein
MTAIGVNGFCILWATPCKYLCTMRITTRNASYCNQPPSPFNRRHFSERRWITQAQRMKTRRHGPVMSTKRPPAAVAVKATLEELCSRMAMPMLLDILWALSLADSPSKNLFPGPRFIITHLPTDSLVRPLPSFLARRGGVDDKEACAGRSRGKMA